MSLDLVLLCVASYLLGAIPFGVIIARAHGVDIMKVGSGNIGATNVKRALGSKAAYSVFALDVLKGLVPVLVAQALGHRQEICFLVGVFAVVGHCLSPFLKFKGGKGVATTLGIALGASPWVALIGFAIFMVLLLTVRYMSLASMIGIASTLVFGPILGDSPYIVVGYGLMTLFVVYRHRANIKRLREGTEPKFSFRSEKKEAVKAEGEQAPSLSPEPAVASAHEQEGR